MTPYTLSELEQEYPLLKKLKNFLETNNIKSDYLDNGFYYHISKAKKTESTYLTLRENTGIPTFVEFRFSKHPQKRGFISGAFNIYDEKSYDHAITKIKYIFAVNDFFII